MVPTDKDIIETEASNSDSQVSDNPEALTSDELGSEEIGPEGLNPEGLNNNEPTKQSTGRGLALVSLLLALIALIVSGWIYYRSEFKVNQPTALESVSQDDLAAINQQLESLNNSLQTLKAQQKKAQQDSQQQQTKLQQISEAANQHTDLTTTNNELSTLRQQLKSLAAEMKQAPNEPQIEPYLEALAQAQAVQALKSVQLLLQQNQLKPAVDILKQWRNHPQLPLAVQTRLQQIITRLSNLTIPDTAALKNQLATLKDDINSLSLAAQEVTKAEPAWYDRFITVKKIEPEFATLNSADLQQLKANALAQLNQAELALLLQQPDNWQSALRQTADIMSASVLDTKALKQKLNTLQNQAISVSMPKNLGIDTLIQQIEGFSE